MATVTQRANEVRQPRGGYLPIKAFSKIERKDNRELYPQENISASLIGMCVDYLTRYMTGSSKKAAFDISLKGARRINKIHIARALLSNISGIDDLSIISACKLVGFDVCYRSSTKYYKPVEEITPDQKTIDNIRIMLERSLEFWKDFGPIRQYEFTFEGGYTNEVTSGDGDYLTDDTLWDIKVLKSTPTSKNTLQILMYYIMGKHSDYRTFDRIKKLGIYNPRLNVAYLLPVTLIGSHVYKEVAEEVIGYKGNTGQRKQKTVARELQQLKRYTVEEVCRILSVSKSQVYKSIQNGEISVSREKNRYYVSAYEVKKYRELLKNREKQSSWIRILRKVLR